MPLACFTFYKCMDFKCDIEVKDINIIYAWFLGVLTRYNMN